MNNQQPLTMGLLNHHPEPELLLQYSSGQLNSALAIAVGLHQKRCSICQQQIQQLESLGGSAIEKEINEPEDCQQLPFGDEAEMSSSWDKLLMEVQQLSISEKEESDDKVADYFEPSVALASDHLKLFEQIDQLKIGKKSWKRVTSKIWKTEFPLDDSSYQLELLKFAPNAKIPKHSHCGTETTQILQGEFSDEDGTYGTGEFLYRDQSDEHQPIAGKDGCICLAITDAPLKFTGFFGPVLNLLTRN